MALKAHERWHNPEYKKKISEKIKETWDLERRSNMSKIRKEAWQDPEYRNNISEKIKAIWNKPEYRSNMSEKIKEAWQDPNSKYNLPEYIEKLRGKSSDSENKLIEVIKSKKQDIIRFNPHYQEYFEKYLKIHNYFDQKNIVKDYIRNEFRGNRIKPNVQVNIEQSFDLLIDNNLETGVIEHYAPTIYRRKRGKVN